MGYRIHSKPKPRPQRTLVDVATPGRIYVHNGTIAHLAFPCWYQEVHKPIPAHPHNVHLHDHRGWPSPSHPDHVCQMWQPDRHCCSIGMRHECSPHCRHYIDLAGLHPVHLTAEGFTEAVAVVNASDDPELATAGIDPVAAIDVRDDWVVRVTLDVNDAEALYEPQVYKLSVFAIAPDRRDLVALTEVVVLPSSYQLEDSEGE